MAGLRTRRLRKMLKPYMREGRMTEDPVDGTHPPKSSRNANRSQKKSARQKAKAEIFEDMEHYMESVAEDFRSTANQCEDARNAAAMIRGRRK